MSTQHEIPLSVYWVFTCKAMWCFLQKIFRIKENLTWLSRIFVSDKIDSASWWIWLQESNANFHNMNAFISLSRWILMMWLSESEIFFFGEFSFFPVVYDHTLGLLKSDVSHTIKREKKLVFDTDSKIVSQLFFNIKY